MQKIGKKWIVVGAVVLIIIGGVWYFKAKGGGVSVYESVAVKRGDVTQEVNTTGRVKPARNVDLAFEKTGRISWIGAKVGDKVSEGQTIARLDAADAVSQIAQAEASLKMQKAKLDEMKKGTRQEEIKVYETKVTSAETSVNEAKKDMTNKIQDAYTRSEDAVRNKIDQLFINPRTSNPTFNFSGVDGQLKSDIEWGRFLAENTISSWALSLNNLSFDNNLDSYITAGKNNLNQVKSFLEKIALAVNGLTSNSTLSQTTIDGYKTDVSTARTNLNTAMTNFLTAEEKLKTAEATLAQAKQDLALKKAGSTAEQIAQQEAQVEEAEANVKNYEAQFKKTYLIAPILGTVTKQDAKVGEIASANTVLVSLISTSQFEVESNVQEADIAKLKISDMAKITLDAYGKDVIFDATITAIDPAETMIEGVATYKTTFQFVNKDARIKSGMTADIDVLTAKKENVLFVPQRAVTATDGDKIVKILTNDGKKEIISEVKVKTGLRGSDGNMEILEGLAEGDKVVVYEKK